MFLTEEIITFECCLLSVYMLVAYCKERLFMFPLFGFMNASSIFLLPFYDQHLKQTFDQWRGLRSYPPSSIITNNPGCNSTRFWYAAYQSFVKDFGVFTFPTTTANYHALEGRHDLLYHFQTNLFSFSSRLRLQCTLHTVSIFRKRFWGVHFSEHY